MHDTNDFCAIGKTHRGRYEAKAGLCSWLTNRSLQPVDRRLRAVILVPFLAEQKVVPATSQWWPQWQLLRFGKCVKKTLVITFRNKGWWENFFTQAKMAMGTFSWHRISDQGVQSPCRTFAQPGVWIPVLGRLHFSKPVLISFLVFPSLPQHSSYRKNIYTLLAGCWGNAEWQGKTEFPRNVT